MPHYIRPNDANTIPTQIITIGLTEMSDPEHAGEGAKRTVLDHVAAQYLRYRDNSWSCLETFQGRSGPDLWKWIDSHCAKKTCVWVFFVDARLTLTLTDWWNWLDQGKHRFSTPDYDDPVTGKRKRGFKGCICLEDSPAFCKLLSLRGRINLVDVGNYFPMGINQLAQEFDFQEYRDDLIAAPEPDRRFVALERCRLTSHVVTELLTFWNSLNCGVFQMTAGSLAMHSWRHSALGPGSKNPDLYVLTDESTETNNWERQGYYGARIEPLFYGTVAPRDGFQGLENDQTWLPPTDHVTGPLWEFDLCSFYPWVMATHYMPCRRVGFEREPKIVNVMRRLQVDGAMAFLRIDSANRPYPLKTEQGMIHAVGYFDTWLCGEELRTALENNHVDRIHEIRWYALADLFGDWVRMWFNRRVKAHEQNEYHYDRFCALILRSLYGKWAQRGRRWIDAPDVPPESRWGTWHGRYAHEEEMSRYRSLAGIVQRLDVGDDPAHCFPAISAFITAGARNAIQSLLDKMPARSVLYVNTDALYVLEPGRDWLENNGMVADFQLGFFRVKGVHEWARVSGVNDLELGEKLVRSGIPKREQTRTATGFTALQCEAMDSLISRGPLCKLTYRKVAFDAKHDVWKNRVQADGWALPKRIDCRVKGKDV